MAYQVTVKTDIKTILLWVLPFGGVALVIIVFVVVWNRRLEREIEFRKIAEQETQAGERKLMAMSQASHDAMIMIDSDDRVMFWNPAAEQMFCYTVDEAMGKKLPDLILPSDDRRSIWEGLSGFKDMSDGKASGNVIEAEAIRKDGNLFPTQWAVSPFQLEGNWFAVSTVRDVTEQRAAEKALRESEEHSRLLLESVGEGILGVDIGTSSASPGPGRSFRA